MRAPVTLTTAPGDSPAPSLRTRPIAHRPPLQRPSVSTSTTPRSSVRSFSPSRSLSPTISTLGR